MPRSPSGARTFCVCNTSPLFLARPSLVPCSRQSFFIKDFFFRSSPPNRVEVRCDFVVSPRRPPSNRFTGIFFFSNGPEFTPRGALGGFPQYAVHPFFLSKPSVFFFLCTRRVLQCPRWRGWPPFLGVSLVLPSRGIPPARRSLFFLRGHLFFL